MKAAGIDSIPTAPRVLRQPMEPTDDIMTSRLECSTLDELALEAYAIATDAGWWPQATLERVLGGDATELAKSLCLIHSEVSEALEDVRERNFETVVDLKGKPTGFQIELADIIIRVLGLSGAMGIKIGEAVAQKMAYNATQSHQRKS